MQHNVNFRLPMNGVSKRQRTAALQDLAEGATRNLSRQRLGVRLPSAAFSYVSASALLRSLTPCLSLEL